MLCKHFFVYDDFVQFQFVLPLCLIFRFTNKSIFICWILRNSDAVLRSWVSFFVGYVRPTTAAVTYSENRVTAFVFACSNFQTIFVHENYFCTLCFVELRNVSSLLSFRASRFIQRSTEIWISLRCLGRAVTSRGLYLRTNVGPNPSYALVSDILAILLFYYNN